jgi:ABC-type dipeptide/oligopeptide/nickel transport system permease subunit
VSDAMDETNNTNLDVPGEGPLAVDMDNRGRSLWADARRRMARDKGTMLCLAVIAVYALVAIGGALYDLMADHPDWSQRLLGRNVPRFVEMKDYAQAYKSPSLKTFGDLLGTDWAGRSVLVKAILGAKVSLTVGLMANVIAIPLGMLLGGLAGYYGGWFDDIIVWLYSTLQSIPGIILLIAMKSAFKGVSVFGLDLTGIHGLYLALGVLNWVGTCRLVRAEVMKIRELDYVVAARASGRGSFPILLRHVLPNVFHIAIINFSLGFVGAVQSEVILSYLGLGVAVGTPSWGEMINGARMDLFAGRWWELTSAVSAMFFLVLALNIFGDRLRDALDPRLKNV